MGRFMSTPLLSALLSAALQTRNPMARREMYERELRAAGPQARAAFAQLVEETLLALELVEDASLSCDFTFDAIGLVDEVVIDFYEF